MEEMPGKAIDVKPQAFPMKTRRIINRLIKKGLKAGMGKTGKIRKMYINRQIPMLHGNSLQAAERQNLVKPER